MACSISGMAQEGMSIEVAVYQRVEVSKLLMTRVFPLNLGL